MLNPLKLLILGFAIASALLSRQARAIAGQTSVIDADTLDRSCVNGAPAAERGNTR